MGLREGSSFGDKFAPLEGESAARPVLTVKSVTPGLKSVLGGDPYGAVENAVNEEQIEKLPESYTSSILVLNDAVNGENEAKITLPKPRKLRLKINSANINPSFTHE